MTDPEAVDILRAFYTADLTEASIMALDRAIALLESAPVLIRVDDDGVLVPVEPTWAALSSVITDRLPDPPTP